MPAEEIVILTPAEIELVREICGLNSFAQADELVGMLPNAGRVQTQADCAEWQTVRLSNIDVEPTNSNDGIKLLRETKRQLIRQSMRTRLGLPLYTESELTALEQIGGSAAQTASVPVTFAW